MRYEFTLTFETESDETVPNAVYALLYNTLPYMADNVTIRYTTEES